MELPISYKRYLDQGRLFFTDSRKIIKDGIFIALHGARFDGNEFAVEAIEQGAAYAIVDRIVKSHPRLILVKDTLEELQHMASLNKKLNKAKVIAITGTNGKTTTKELCFSIFKRVYHCIATEGNYNNHIGVPLTLLRITEDTEYSIIEMGANQPGDIAGLCQLADPFLGLITNIGKAHLEGFGDIHGVLTSKMELFDYLRQHHGICVYNMYSKPIRENYLPVNGNIRFGEFGEDVNYSGSLLQSFPTIEMKFSNGDETVSLHSSLFGEYNYQNILSAATIASVCGIPIGQIEEGVSAYVSGNMRSQIIQRDSNTILLDAYNANPSSMKEVIDIFDKMNFSAKWIILGEMAELGVNKGFEHDALFQLVDSKHFDRKILIGDSYANFRNESGVIFFSNVSECKSWMDANWPDHTAILIKGSRSAMLEKLIH